MLRVLVLLVLLANALFFAWARGWLGPGPRAAEREPQRLAEQVRPEVVSVLAPTSASAAVQAARAAARLCLEAGPFGAGDLSTAEALLLAAQLPADAWQRQELPPPAPWAVYAGRYPEAPLRRSREEDLKQLGLSWELISAPPELAPGLVLSRHATREAAEAWLKDSTPAGLRGARVVQLPAGSTSWRLRVPNAEPELAERLKALAADALAGGFKPCAAARS
jgi:hypothetical protein